MGGLFGSKPKPPPVPKPITKSAAEVRSEEEAVLASLQNQRGRASTILSGDDGDVEDGGGVAKKKLGGSSERYI